MKKKIQQMEIMSQKKDQSIRTLEKHLEGLSKQHRQFLGKYDESKILEEIKVLVGENQELKSGVREIKSELDYGKQRENKLMYFLFVLQKKGVPIYEIFDNNIKDLPTARFSPDLDDQYKKIYFEQIQKILNKRKKPFNWQVERFTQSVECKRIRWFDKDSLPKEGEPDSLNTTESYVPICGGPMILPKRPDFIPKLDLVKVEKI